MLVQMHVSDVCLCLSAGSGWIECPHDKPPPFQSYHEMHQQQIPPTQYQTVAAGKGGQSSSGVAQAVYAVLCQTASHRRPSQYVAAGPTGELKKLMKLTQTVSLSIWNFASYFFHFVLLDVFDLASPGNQA